VLYPDIIATNPPWDKRLESGSDQYGDDGDNAWRKLIEFARIVWDPNSRKSHPLLLPTTNCNNIAVSSIKDSSDSKSLLPPRYPLWMLSGNDRMMQYFDDKLNNKPAYLHNIKSQSATGNLQLLKYYFK